MSRRSISRATAARAPASRTPSSPASSDTSVVICDPATGSAGMCNTAGSSESSELRDVVVVVVAGADERRHRARAVEQRDPRRRSSAASLTVRSNGRQRPSGVAESRWGIPVGSSSTSPGISWIGSAPSTRSHAVPDVSAWNDAPELCGSARPHGACARTFASIAPRTRLTSITSASGSIARALPLVSVRHVAETNGQEIERIESLEDLHAVRNVRRDPDRQDGEMQIEGQTVVVTGANRGLGRSLVEALLDRGAAKVYAAARNAVGRVRPTRASSRSRSTSLDRETIAAAARQAGDATVLINNASTAAFAAPARRRPATPCASEMVVNFDGTFDVIRAFVPVLERNGGGAIVNVLSLLSLASTPPMAGYSASKAAAHSLTQALRPVLKAKSISVHGVYPAGIDTDMLAGIDAPKTPAATGRRRRARRASPPTQEDIFPDPNAQAMAATWWSDPKTFERAFSGA